MPRDRDLEALQHQGLLGRDVLQLPARVPAAAVVLDAAQVGVDEDEVLQRGDAAIGGELLAAVVGSGGGGEDLDDQRGRA